MIISISGNKNSGKDLVGKIILYFMSECDQEESRDFVETDDYVGASNWEIKKFADNVTKSYEIITGLDFHKLSREDKESFRISYRDYAEKCKNVFGENVWINGLMRDYKYELKYSLIPSLLKNTKSIPDRIYPKWIITDLRFPNEYQAVKDKGFTIHVNRNTETIDNHSSENTKELINHFDDNVIFVANNGTTEELVKQIKLILLLNKKLIQ